MPKNYSYKLLIKNNLSFMKYLPQRQFDAIRVVSDNLSHIDSALVDGRAQTKRFMK